MALQQVIAQQGRPWEIRMVNRQEQLDSLDIFRRITGIRLQDYYNLLLKKGWTLGSGELLKGLHVVIRLFQPALVRLLRDFWRAGQPDMVVSLIPNFNRALKLSLEAALPGPPLVTILTDIADYPPHFWIERQQQYLICGSDRAVEQEHSMGHPGERVFRASGMILHPRFYDAPVQNRIAGRERLGFRPDLPTGLVLFGGHGSDMMLEIAKRLDSSSLDLQLIFVCGKNEKLANELRERKSRVPCFVEGFTTRVNEYMQLADFFIGKPGPGSVSEALAIGLPVIVECNAWTLPQERYNADWIVEKQVGLVLRSFDKIDEAVTRLIEPSALDRYRANAAALGNRAVFEIPEILAKIFDQSRGLAHANHQGQLAGKLA